MLGVEHERGAVAASNTQDVVVAVVSSETALIFGHLNSHQLASLFLAHVGRLLENEMCDQQLTPASIEETK